MKCYTDVMCLFVLYFVTFFLNSLSKYYTDGRCLKSWIVSVYP